MKEDIRKIKDIANRITAQTPDVRALRGLIVELCNVFLGIEEDHPDVDSSGARFPAPVLHQLAAPAPLPPPLPVAAPRVARPGGGPISIGEALAKTGQLRAVPGAAAPAPAGAPLAKITPAKAAAPAAAASANGALPVNGTPAPAAPPGELAADPAGDTWLENVQANLNNED